jgi:hypothetical protein
MKKIITFMLLIFLVGTLNAQWYGKKIKGNGKVVTENRNVSDYDEISVAGSFDVKLVSGQEGKLMIKAEENLLEYLITEVKDGDLKIKWKKGVSIRSNKEVLVTVPFKSIEGVSLAGSGDVFTEDVIEADKFKVALSGSGDIKLRLKAIDVSSAVSGSGDIQLRGTTNSFKCSIAGSGDFHGYELTTKEADISIAGSGGVKVYVTEKLKGRIAGSGDIYYKGEPKIQDVKVSGSGSVSSQ